MHRFFMKSEDALDNNRIMLQNTETLHHAKNVLRMTLGEACEIVNDDLVLIAEITSMDETQIILEVKKRVETLYESPVNIDLFQCLPKGAKLELIIQKNVELGVRDFYLVDSKRCIVDFKHKDLEKKLGRFQKIASEAAKQSKRTYISDVQGVLKLNQLNAKFNDYDLVVVLYEAEDDQTIKSVLSDQYKNIAIIVGPEGGFDSSEIEYLAECGAKITTLGKRILRTETAGFVAVTCVQYAIGDLS